MNAKLQQAKSYALVCLKWTLLAVLVGCVVGPCGAVFGIVLERIIELRTELGWLPLFFLPVMGPLIVGMFHLAKQPNGGNTNAVFVAVRNNETMPFRAAPLIFLSTCMTHLVGGSAGREGAALQLGGSLAGTLGRIFKVDEHSGRIMTMCGMSAGFSAIFGTPLTSAVFALESSSVGVMYYTALFPAVLSSLIALFISKSMGLAPTAFPLSDVMELDPLTLVQVSAFSVVVALLSIAVCEVLHGAPKLYAKYIPNPYLRAAAGGAIVLALSLLEGSGDYNNAGGSIIAAAVAGETIVPWAFALKILFTALTLGAGFKGGEIVPVFFCGATFGAVFGPLLGIPSGLGAALGLVALFCGVTNCPIASTLLAMELFGGQNMQLFMLACGISYLVSGYFGLYTEQKIMYSKTGMHFIDRKLSEHSDPNPEHNR